MYFKLLNIFVILRGIAEVPENDFGQAFDADDSYPSNKLILGLGKIVNVTAQALSDWTGKDSTYLSLKSGDIIEVTENQVCLNNHLDIQRKLNIPIIELENYVIFLFNITDFILS